MPRKFELCRKRGGRIRTIKPKGKGSRTYMHVCFPKGGGPSVRGEIKKRKKRKK